ncbi:hypothetical protein Scep_011556 [Stephania cephalantha]|uniref:Uncharacterized protein n=1 Tax=Stephania cephalantha TaxID=152367 RepID=A0AAP0JDK9_9MAGN
MVHTNSVSFGNGSYFGEVSMANFMTSLAKKLKKNTTAELPHGIRAQLHEWTGENI